MKSEKGITAISLVIYVISFLSITVIIGIITTFFYRNINTIDSNISSGAEYNKFNLFMLNEIKKSGVTVEISTDADTAPDGNQIIFTSSDGLTKNKFTKLGNILYFNKIKLCEGVSEFKLKEDSSTGKKTIKVLLTIGQKSYSTEYTVE